MSIRGLKDYAVASFTGKNTAVNLTAQAMGTLTAASNTMILSDQQVRRAPGYTAVVAAPDYVINPGASVFDFERSVDSKQFVFVQRGTQITAMQADGSNPAVVATLQSSTPLMWVGSAIIAYASNGTDALRFVDKAGTLTAYNWGIVPPATAPSIAISAGTLTLTYGRRYVRCFVSKYTDSLGIERVSVSGPSPISAFTGPVSNAVITLSNMTGSTDPQVTHQWIFATSDSPIDTSATFFFEAEITNATTTFADTIIDQFLDQTRLAPFGIAQAPPSHIVTNFQGRMVMIEKNLIQLSGGSDVILGIPDEAFPQSLFFNIPAGSREATAAMTTDDGTVLVVSTAETWFRYTGYDASSFTEQDRVASPGAVGRWALCQTPYGIIFLSESKRLWLWDGSTNNPMELSAAVASILMGTVGMESLDSAFLPNVHIHWYSYGLRHFIAVTGRTTDALPAYPGNNWMSIWGVPGNGIGGQNAEFQRTNTLFQTDKFPTDYWTASAPVKVGNVPYLFFTARSGAVHRFPDTFQDNGNNYDSAFSHAWFAPTDGMTRYYWADIFVDAPPEAMGLGGPSAIIQVSATVLEAPENSSRGIAATVLDLRNIPNQRGQESYFAVRAKLVTPATSSGRYIRINVALSTMTGQPVTFDMAVQKIVVYAAPIFDGMP